MITSAIVIVALFLIAALASAEKSPPRGALSERAEFRESSAGRLGLVRKAGLSARSESAPPRKALPAPCEVQCLEAKNAALQKLAVKRLKGWRKAERRRVALKNALRSKIKNGTDGVTKGFQCIHHFEGSWTDSGAPYWGGLQMDESFMGTYGYWFRRKLGTADHWPAFVQIAVAMNAYYSGRGYGPWPNTARYCGLLP